MEHPVCINLRYIGDFFHFNLIRNRVQAISHIRANFRSRDLNDRVATCKDVKVDTIFDP